MINRSYLIKAKALLFHPVNPIRARKLLGGRKVKEKRRKHRRISPARSTSFQNFISFSKKQRRWISFLFASSDFWFSNAARLFASSFVCSSRRFFLFSRAMNSRKLFGVLTRLGSEFCFSSSTFFRFFCFLLNFSGEIFSGRTGIDGEKRPEGASRFWCVTFTQFVARRFGFFSGTREANLNINARNFFFTKHHDSPMYGVVQS